MIGADTNVVLRFLLRDDERQWARADAFVRGRSADDPVFLSLVALVELVWVLRRTYKKSASAVGGVVRDLLGADQFLIEHEQLVIRALRDSEEFGTDFADAVIAHLGVEAGADGTVTFDQVAAELPGMLAL